MKHKKQLDEEGFKSFINDESNINDLEDEISRLEKLKQEKEAVEKFKEEAKNNEILKKNNIQAVDSTHVKIIKRSYYSLFKYSFIILAVIFIFSIISFGYFASNDKFKSQVLCGDTQCQECQECNNVTVEGSICDLKCPDINITFPDSINIINSS